MSGYVRQARFPLPKIPSRRNNASAPRSAATSRRRYTMRGSRNTSSNRKNSMKGKESAKTPSAPSEKNSGCNTAGKSSSLATSQKITPLAAAAAEESLPSGNEFIQVLVPTKAVRFHQGQGTYSQELSQLTEDVSTDPSTHVHVVPTATDAASNFEAPPYNHPKLLTTAADTFERNQANSSDTGTITAPGRGQDQPSTATSRYRIPPLHSYCPRSTSTHERQHSESSGGTTTIPKTHMLGQPSFSSSLSTNSSQYREQRSLSSSSHDYFANHPMSYHKPSITNNWNKKFGCDNGSIAISKKSGLRYDLRNFQTPARMRQEQALREQSIARQRTKGTKVGTSSSWTFQSIPIQTPLTKSIKARNPPQRQPATPFKKQQDTGIANFSTGDRTSTPTGSVSSQETRKSHPPPAQQSSCSSVAQENSISTTISPMTHHGMEIFTKSLDQTINNFKDELDSHIMPNFLQNAKAKLGIEATHDREDKIQETGKAAIDDIKALMIELETKIDRKVTAALKKIKESENSAIDEFRAKVNEFERRKNKHMQKVCDQESIFFEKVRKIENKQRVTHKQLTKDLEEKSRDATDKVTKVVDEVRKVAESYVSIMKSIAASVRKTTQRFLGQDFTTKQEQNSNLLSPTEFVSPAPTPPAPSRLPTKKARGRNKVRMTQDNDSPLHSLVFPNNSHKKRLLPSYSYDRATKDEESYSSEPRKKRRDLKTRNNTSGKKTLNRSQLKPLVLAETSASKNLCINADTPKRSPLSPLVSIVNQQNCSDRTKGNQASTNFSQNTKVSSFVTPSAKLSRPSSPLKIKPSEISISVMRDRARRSKRIRAAKRIRKLSQSGICNDFSFFSS